MTVVQLRELVGSLETQLGRLREQATVDLQNLHNDLMAKNRELGRLKAEIAKTAEDSPEAAEAKALLGIWRDVIKNGRKNVDISLSSDRGAAVRRAIKRYGTERVRKAILGCQFDDFAMGRTSRQDRPYNDIAKHIVRDSDRFEHFEQLYENHHPEARPAQAELSLVTGDREPESVERQFVRHVYGDDCQLPYRPTSKEPRPVRVMRDPPIDRVLGSLHAKGCTVIAYDARPDQWSATCPAHDDSSPSLAVHRKPDGMVLLTCFAGCLTEDVLSALDLQWRDLWEESEHDLGARDVIYRQPRVVPQHLRQAMQQLLAADEQRVA